MTIDLFQQEQAARQAGEQAMAARLAATEQAATEAARNEAEEKTYGLFDRIHDKAAPAERVKGKRDEALGRLRSAIQANPGLDSGDPMQTVARLSVVLLGLGGAYVLDLILFSSLVSYLLQMVGIDSASALVGIARVVVPAMIVAVEVVIATLLYSAKQKAGNRFRGAVLGWTILAIAMAVGMSALTAATFVAGEGVDSFFDLTLADLLLMVPITVFSGIPHAIVLFSGRYGSEGKAHLYLLWRRFRVRWLNWRYDRRGAKVLRAYHEYERARHNYRQTYDRSIEPGTFSEAARRIINERLGAEVIPPPRGTAYCGDGSMPPPPLPSRRDEVRPDSETDERHRD